MMDTMARGPALDVKALLEHEGFVRALARTLVRDENEADDVAQQAMVAAIESPPEPRPQGVRGWFATVVRNVVRQRRRGERRRHDREAAAARAEGVPSTAHLLERETARRTVVEAVLALDEPYRSAIVLRYFEALPPRDVAERLGVPVETARTRVKRGVAMLRERLDRRHGGDRPAWIAILLPLSDSPPPAVPDESSAAHGPGVRLAPLAWTAASLVAVAGIAFAAGAFDAPRDAVAPGGFPPPLVRSRFLGPSDAPAGPSTALASVGSRDPRATALAGQALLHGFALGVGRVPADEARVLAWPMTADPDGIADPSSVARLETTTDAQGRFELPSVARGPWWVAVEKKGMGRAKAIVRAEADPAWSMVWLAPTPSAPTLAGRLARSVEEDSGPVGTVRGRVVRGDDGRPVAGARVLVDDLAPLVTDARGEYELPRVPLSEETGPSEVVVEVVPPDAFLARDRRVVRVAPRETARLDHRVGEGGTLVASTEPVGALAVRRPGERDRWASALPHVGEDGADLVTPSLPTGDWELVSAADQGDPLVLARFTIRPGQTTYVDTLAGADVVVSGRVTRGGEPLEGAWVSALGLGLRPTGPDGRYEFKARLGARMFTVASVRPPEADGVEIRQMASCMASGRTIEQDFAIPRGAVSVNLTDAAGRPAAGSEATILAGKAVEVRPATRFADGAGRVRWSGLPAGEYRVDVRFLPGDAHASATLRIGVDEAEAKANVVEPAK
jgi:RNA polymerase sigma-70 factor (ECF subfamily)